MKTILTKLTLLCLCLVFLTSCVAKRKYYSARNKADSEQKEITALNSQLSGMNDSVNLLNIRLSEMSKKISELGYEQQVSADQLNATANQLNMTKDQVAAQRKRMLQLQNLINQQQNATEALRAKIADALTGFNSSELTITTKNGRIYISMQESLLFPSGSAVVNPKGKEALLKVASVLNTNGDINIDIEGHTDSVAIHNKMYNDNWSLSTARATSIAHVLIDDYAVSPRKLIASGRSFYDPVATNSTASGRALNRRTEIILEPKLDELMELINNNGNTTKN